MTALLAFLRPHTQARPRADCHDQRQLSLAAGHCGHPGWEISLWEGLGNVEEGHVPTNTMHKPDDSKIYPVRWISARGR